jgi:hypothetical protein
VWRMRVAREFLEEGEEEVWERLVITDEIV